MYDINDKSTRVGDILIRFQKPGKDTEAYFDWITKRRKKLVDPERTYAGLYTKHVGELHAK